MNVCADEGRLDSSLFGPPDISMLGINPARLGRGGRVCV